MSKSYRRGGEDRFESRRRRNERQRNPSNKRSWQDRDLTEGNFRADQVLRTVDPSWAR